jgi:excisionase family DNA binding protein
MNDRVGNTRPKVGQLLTVQEAADFLNVSVRFVRRLIAEHRVAVVRLGRHVRLAKSDLEAFVTTSRQEPVRSKGTRFGRPA